MWYTKKFGEKFETILYCRFKAHTDADDIVGFMCIGQALFFIHPTDCEIISERIEYDYKN